MKNKNKNKKKKNLIKEKGTNKVIRVYYSIVRLERFLFDLIGPYVWKEYVEWEYWADSYHTKNCHYEDINDAINLKNKLNFKLSKKEIETYIDTEIL